MFGDKNLLKIEKRISQNGEIFINIHLSIAEELKLWVAEINKQLNKGVYYDIVYGENSLMQPHITLLICRLKPANRLNKVLEEITKIVKDTPTFEIEFDSFSMSENKHWAFLWVKENPIITNLVYKLKSALAQFLTFDYDSAPHISLARSNELAVNEDVLKNLSTPPKQKINQIAVALSGYHGTVLKIIKEFNLK